MYTYQDLEKIDNEQGRKDFIISAINQHKGSKKYSNAKITEDYYDGENTTIKNYFKIIYDSLGKAQKDDFAANHKISSKFVGNAVDQEVSYLLSNGVSFGNKDTKDKLGINFDEKICDMLTNAENHGVCFGFWNLDHLEVFPLIDSEASPGFVPLYDEENGGLRAGIRYWRIGNEKPLRATLYEEKGYTEYKQDKNGEVEIIQELKPYKLKYRQTKADGLEFCGGENYGTLPIFPLQYNKKEHTVLQGKRNTVDALDLVTSNMINNVDEANLIYWILVNCEGMNDLDDRKFLDRLRTTHVAHAGEGENAARVEAHSVETPHVAIDSAYQTLTRRLYFDFNMFDASIVTAGNQTATAIMACYTPLDLKADKTEKQVTKFINNLLNLIGIKDKPTYTRNRILNKNEEIQSLLMGSEHLSTEYVTKKLLTIYGDIDMLDEVNAQKQAEETEKMKIAMAMEGVTGNETGA